MKVFFGLEFDESVFKTQEPILGGTHFLGPKGLLFMLESHLGLISPANDVEHIRIEHFRQCLSQYLETSPTAFYKESFEADQLATATRLLQMRDELVLAFWNFEDHNLLPERLKFFRDLEDVLQNAEQEFALGYADRFVKVVEILKSRNQPIKSIILNEPFDILPSHFKSLFEELQNHDVKIFENKIDFEDSGTDLSTFQKNLLRVGDSKKQTLRGDGYLIIIRSPRETDAATFLAKIFAQNDDFRPLCLIPEKNRALDNALSQEGLPSLGILSASLARPSLQILKLIPAFLWRPIDPFKIMEFVSLAVKPLADDLAELIAVQMAQRPGLNSDSWRYMIRNYFSALKQRSQSDPSIDAKQIEDQYKFWFERKRYDANKSVPIKDVIEIFNFLSKWAFEVFEEGNEKNTSLQVLSGQARRVVEMLEAQPKNQSQLSYLELERIVRTIYEPSPVVFRETEVGHLSFVYNSSAVIDPIDQLVWWNFTKSEREHFFSRWHQSEIQFLENQGVFLQSPQDENAILLWQRPRAILKARQRAVLVIPEKVDGSTVFSHPLFDELEACFENVDEITINTAAPENIQLLKDYFKIQDYIKLPHKQLGQPKPFINISEVEKLQPNEYETFSSLNTLFYYPYQWVFRHKIKLKKSSILSIVSDVPLLGNLAHRFFELLLKEEKTAWTKTEIESWVDAHSYDLLAKEGTVLLLYGKEPEKVAFLKKIKHAAWSLISMIQNNGWQIKATEMSLEGSLAMTSVKGIADLVLQRGDEYLIIDLKWRGAAYRQRIIKNEEDLQLVTYSKLLTTDNDWAHTAYFIIDQGKMIARNNLALKESVSVSPDKDHAETNKLIWERMQRTYQWRLQQLAKGQIEIRTEQTLLDLEDAYANQLMELLEMKDKDAPFDDYRTLINLIN